LRLLMPVIGLVALATLVLILVVLIVPGWAAAALRWYLIGIAALAALATLRAIASRYPPYPAARRNPFARPPREPDEQPQRLREIDRLVSYSRWSPVDFNERLRPILYAIAAQRLAAYRSVAIATDPAAARTALGERVWSIISPKATSEGHAQVLDLADLRLVVTTLEGINATPHD
jgi:hypothetical protein